MSFYPHTTPTAFDVLVLETGFRFSVDKPFKSRLVHQIFTEGTNGSNGGFYRECVPAKYVTVVTVHSDALTVLMVFLKHE